MNESPVNLLARLPPSMQQYDEIQKITESQNPEFDLLREADALMRNNLYITTAEKEGLRRYEKLLNITPLPDEDLESRRNRILVRWNQKTPYSYRYLISQLEILTGGNYEVNPNFKDYMMEIVVFKADARILSDLAFILRNIIPANIVITSTNKIHIYARGYIEFATTINTVKHYTIVQDFKTEITTNMKVASSGSVIKVIEHRIEEGG